jgi:hypothetical protein
MSRCFGRVFYTVALGLIIARVGLPQSQTANNVSPARRHARKATVTSGFLPTAALRAHLATVQGSDTVSGIWMDSYNYLWTLYQDASGNISGTVNVGESSCPSPIWSVAGSITGEQFTITATNPTGGDYECDSWFTYSMVIAVPGLATGTWVSSVGNSGSVTMTESTDPTVAVIPSSIDFGSVTPSYRPTRHLQSLKGPVRSPFLQGPQPRFLCSSSHRQRVRLLTASQSTQMIQCLPPF